jgi:hypothetical protein
MVTLEITRDSIKLTNECPFVVTHFLGKERPVGVRVGSNYCQNCPNYISATEDQVTCKGEKLLTDLWGNPVAPPVKTTTNVGELVGKEFTIVARKDDYTILEQLDNGYLTVQPSAFRRAGMDGGKEMIHKSEIDGVHYKFH